MGSRAYRRHFARLADRAWAASGLRGMRRCLSTLSPRPSACADIGLVTRGGIRQRVSRYRAATGRGIEKGVDRVAGQHQWDIVSGVGLTALGVAGARAAENHRPDRLVCDPFAEDLVRAADSGLPLLGADASDALGSVWDSVVGYMGLRTRFFDDFFGHAVAAGVSQAVILASGLDTRAVRLSWPDRFPVFEIDQPLVLQFKNRTLAELGATASSAHHPVASDLRGDWATALTEAGFDPDRPTAWLAEGLLPYLPADAEQALLRTVHECSAPGSRIAIENFAGAASLMTSHPAVQEIATRYGIHVDHLFSSEPRAEAGTTLAGLAWTVHRQPAPELARSVGRDLEEYFTILDGGPSEFLTATRPH